MQVTVVGNPISAPSEYDIFSSGVDGTVDWALTAAGSTKSAPRTIVAVFMRSPDDKQKEQDDHPAPDILKRYDSLSANQMKLVTCPDTAISPNFLCRVAGRRSNP